METFDWDQTITVHSDDEVDAAVAVTINNVKKKQFQETVQFKSASAARDSSHAANILAKERADDAEFKNNLNNS